MNQIRGPPHPLDIELSNYLCRQNQANQVALVARCKYLKSSAGATNYASHAVNRDLFIRVCRQTVTWRHQRGNNHQFNAMNLQDYHKWQDWDQNLSVDQSATKQFPWWICTLAATVVAALWTITIAVELYEWLRDGDPIEIMAALWVVVCVALFLAGMLVAIWN